MDVQMLCLALMMGFISVTRSNPVIGGVMVKEVDVGHLAELPCLSSDDHHLFMFWQLADDRNIVGPGNTLDDTKYDYEVLTGKLMIRGVSTKESGFYKCISRGLNDSSAFKIQVIELIVKTDWEDVWENDFETNLLRSMVAVSVLVLAVAGLLFIITRKQKRNQKFYEMDDSRETSPDRYSKDRKATSVPASGDRERQTGIDNAAMDQVDFPKMFKQMQQEQAIP